MAGHPAPLAVRHAAKINHDGPIIKPELGQCWDWTGYVDKQTGYGQIGIDPRGHHRGAHAVAWELANNQPVPDGLWALHKCHRRRCVRPSHLYVGTPKQNVDDMLEEGVSVWQTNPEAIVHRGADNPKVTLTPADVQEICRRYAAGGIYQYELAAEYRVTQSAISTMVMGRHWSQRKSAQA